MKAKAILAVVVIVVGVVLGARALPGGGRDDGPGWAVVERGDLVLTVDVEGRLASEDSSVLGPPQVSGMWDYKITWLAPEGTAVDAGDPVARFDASELERRLRERRNDADKAVKELERLAADVERQRMDDELLRAEAEARRRKAALAVDVPEALVEASELESARLDLREADLDIAHAETKIEAGRRSAEAQRAVFVAERDRARREIAEIEDAIERMTLRAVRAGTVIYMTNWRDEKKKVGDSAWRGETIIELPDLDRMMAEGEVDEADAGRVAEGQSVRLRLDAHPEVEYSGTVAKVWRTVKRKSWRTPEKIFRLDLALDDTDRDRMRPGMRFRGEIEVGREPDVLLVPIDAVVPTEAGPVVVRETVFGDETVAVALGDRDDTVVEVRSGLDAGDRVATRPGEVGL